MKKLIITTFLLSLVVILIPQIIFAVGDKIYLNVPIGDTKSVDDLGEYIRIFYEFFVTSAGVLAAAMMVIGGYKWITAAGNPSIISGAKEMVISAVTGLVLALTSFLLLTAINPNITSLAPLVIPVVNQLAVEGTAKRLCNFETELDKTEGDGVPVECGKVILPSTDTDEKCLGTHTKDIGNPNYCKIVSNEVSGTTVSLGGSQEEGDLQLINHTITSQADFDLNKSTTTYECNQVYWRGDLWVVSVRCPVVDIGGRDYYASCILEGNQGEFESDPDICSDIDDDGDTHRDGTELTKDLIKDGCGRVTNMRCSVPFP